MAAALQLSEPQTVCQSKRRQQRSEFIELRRCNNPDQQWVRMAASNVITAAGFGLHTGGKYAANEVQQPGYVCVAARRELPAVCLVHTFASVTA